MIYRYDALGRFVGVIHADPAIYEGLEGYTPTTPAHDGQVFVAGAWREPEQAAEELTEEQAQEAAQVAALYRTIEVPEAQPPAPLTPAQLAALYTQAVQAMLDDKARAFGYDDIKSAVTYAEEPAVPKFQAEGRAFRAWRSVVWAACYEFQAAVLAGGDLLSISDFLSTLPEFSL